ncbi:hypothetical protein EJB05_17638, partial [Eragrostis curvula]
MVSVLALALALAGKVAGAEPGATAQRAVPKLADAALLPADRDGARAPAAVDGAAVDGTGPDGDPKPAPIPDGHGDGWRFAPMGTGPGKDFYPMHMSERVWIYFARPEPAPLPSLLSGSILKHFYCN